ncbi:hypothetical protein NOVO_00100 [Rickettsiales bacterium Ac37b]|nr:hypothetical protein NOVO_00100 [Rickettsiales bacterium Ac37b]
MEDNNKEEFKDENTMKIAEKKEEEHKDGQTGKSKTEEDCPIVKPDPKPEPKPDPKPEPKPDPKPQPKPTPDDNCCKPKPKPTPDDCTNKCKIDCCDQDQCHSQPSVDVHVKVSLSGLQGLHSNHDSAHDL